MLQKVIQRGLVEHEVEHHTKNIVFVPFSIVYSHTCNANVLTNISTRFSHTCDHANATSHVRTHTCGPMLFTHAYPRHVSKEMHISPSSTPSSAGVQLVHIPSTMCKMIDADVSSRVSSFANQRRAACGVSPRCVIL